MKAGGTVVGVNSIASDIGFASLQALDSVIGKQPRGLNRKYPEDSTAVQRLNTDSNVDDKVTIESTPDQQSAKKNETKPAGAVSHVVVSYNQHGDIRTKFVDSRNNVVYQIPSEMVAKMEDLMMQPNTSANLKG